MLVVQVLGPIRAWRDGTELALGPAGRKAVFGLLALAGGKPVTRAELVDALWGERPPLSASNVIHTHVKHLRQVLEPDRGARAPSTFLPAVGDGYALTLPPDGVDVVRFRSLVARAVPVARDDPRQAADLLGQALGLWHGRPLADVPVLDAHPAVVTLAGERRAALARHAEVMIAIGAPRDVLPALVEDVAAHGLDEAMHALLVRAYTAAGQRDQAFDTYNLVRRHLAEELGVSPGPELTAAYLDAIEETPVDPAPRAEPRPASSGVNQLPGDVFGFTGRHAELAELGRVLGAGQTGARTGVPIVVVCGTAGVGKTALVLHCAHRLRPDFPDGQLYVDLRGYDPRSPVTAEDALSRLLDGLGVTGADVPVDPDQRAARYRAELADRRVLVVLDNASAVDQVRPLLPGTPGCLVLVTSRTSLAGLVALHGAHRLDLDLLPEPDSTALLRTLIGERVRREPAAAAELAAQCGRLPLALRVAAELAASRPDSALAELTGELADRRRRLHVLDAGDDVRAAVRTVFSWSYLQLPTQVALAFRRLGLHASPDVTPFALAALTGSDQDSSRRTLEVLARNHLVQPVPAGRFVMHDLLRAYAEELAREHDPAPERSAATERLLAHHLATASAAMDLLYPADRPYRPGVSVTPPLAFSTADAARAWLDAERPTLVALCRFAEGDDRLRYATDLANTLFRYLEGGHYADASAIHECALRAAQRSGEDGVLAAALTNLGALRRLLGDYDQAAKHLHEAVELHRRTGDHYGAARALSNLGIVQERLGEYEEAASLHQEALALHQRLGSRYGEAAALLNLGNAYSRPGHHADAAEYLERALELFRRLGDAVGEASALANLGDVCANLRRYPDAVRHLSEAHELFQRLDHSYGVASTLSNLGNVHTRLGDLSQAHRCYTSAVETFRDIGHRYGEASALNGLGEILRTAGRLDEARDAHTSALRIATATGDQDEQDRARAGLGVAHQHA
ncbi:DNA-binding transcriptional activator of the SARP family [Lentzea fradiae]|uniref:DNA-binding transcriptional activator of the SARP family n=1 Tax=Lentzea fradiae TaxID=200378 RepID=A0A1G8BGV5_9PSEU|nr:tetratricopeptide repeat protein [Lentzea fradiae]SDH32472.1 DNA-binding transcriptional activator of the SARP family [Lentzea fradiae]